MASFEQKWAPFEVHLLYLFAFPWILTPGLCLQAKMRAEGLSDAAVRAFRYSYQLFVSSVVLFYVVCIYPRAPAALGRPGLHSRVGD
jgi:hypothetical protein